MEQQYNRAPFGQSLHRRANELAAGRTHEPVDVWLENNKNPINGLIGIEHTDLSQLVDANPVIRESPDYPRFALGFHHWMHASKNKTIMFNQFASKKKVYNVVIGYERYIDDYEQSIGKVSKTFFGLDARPNILSRAFYKLWEILHYYDLIGKSKDFVSAHLAEGPGSFVQATMFYRDMYTKDSTHDKYHAITIRGDNEDTGLDMEKEFIQFYGKEKPQRLYIASNKSDNGDLTKVQTILGFKKSIGAQVDLVTGDGGFEWNNENIQEQECAGLIFGQMLCALHVQKKHGHFVLKVFEMFTQFSLKLVMILGYFYTHVHVIKPLTSRESNSERYLVCKDFRYDEKQIATVLGSLTDVLDRYDKYPAQKKKFLCDFFPALQVPRSLQAQVLSLNMEIANNQFKVINRMIAYIEESNYHGESYARYRDRQIALHGHWIDTFMNPVDHEANLLKSKGLLDQGMATQTAHFNGLVKELVGYGDETKADVVEVVKKPKAKKPTQSRAKKTGKAKSGSKDKSKPKDKSKSKSKSKSKKQAPAEQPDVPAKKTTSKAKASKPSTKASAKKPRTKAEPLEPSATPEPSKAEPSKPRTRKTKVKPVRSGKSSKD